MNYNPPKRWLVTESAKAGQLLALHPANPTMLVALWHSPMSKVVGIAARDLAMGETIVEGDGSMITHAVQGSGFLTNAPNAAIGPDAIEGLPEPDVRV